MISDKSASSKSGKSRINRSNAPPLPAYAPSLAQPWVRLWKAEGVTFRERRSFAIAGLLYSYSKSMPNRAILLAACALLTSGCAKRLTVRGMVLGVDAASKTALISHADIPDYMPAMSMPFRVRQPGELSALHPGAQVQFDLVVSKRGSHIEHVKRLGATTTGVVEDAGDRIILPPNPDQVAIGALMPDFALLDQFGKPVRLSDFRGKVVAIDFIYTRCPLPDVCPRLSANFARLQTRFADKIGKDLVLLSITIDPKYDTSTVLLGYAKIWNAKADAWRFLSGTEGEIALVARRFGMNYWPEEGLITHTSETGVIARDGRLAARINGSAFTAGQLGDLISRELEND